MTKELYREALADARRLKEVAEDDAKRSLIEAVTPRIRDLIERELLRETEDLDQDVPGAPGSPSVSGNLVTDDGVVNGMSPPDDEGKVTLDLDAVVVAGDAGEPVESPMFGNEFEMTQESVASLIPVLRATKSGGVKELEVGLYRLGESIDLMNGVGPLVLKSKGFSDKITQMISRVENMYDYVQESVTDARKKSSYEAKLESYFGELNKLQERKMSKKSLKDLMNESDVTLKLTGLPDEIDLDSVGVDLITGEEDEEGGEEGGDDLDLDGGDEGGDEGGDDLDLDGMGGGQDEGGDDQMGESRRLSDDTIVEIDEGMLRREISRMKRLREDVVPSTKGSGANAVLDQFGGGKSEGEPWLDGEVTTEGDEDDDDQDDLDEADGPDGDLTMDENQDDLDESDDQDDLDEMDMYQAQDEREAGGDVAPSSMGAGAGGSKQSREPGQTLESIKRRISFEKRLQERTRKAAVDLRTEARKAGPKKLELLKKQDQVLRARFTESVNRTKKMTKTLAEAKSRKGAAANGSPNRPAESKAEGTLRTKLAETNLFNAKLVYTNKLLQNEALSKKQKASIIERLDEANSLREVKLIYESLSKTLSGTSRSLTESATRGSASSSSRVSRSGATPLNEGYETERWARLAGINK